MRKILAVVEDFNILRNLEGLLKKTGFDAFGVFNEHAVHEQMLSIRPDILIIFGRGQRVSYLSLGRKLKDFKEFEFKVILLVEENQTPSPAELAQMKLDSILTLPLQEEKLLHILAKLTKLDEASLLDKYHRSLKAESSSAEKVVSITRVALPSKDAMQEKVSKYKGFLQGVEIAEESTITRSETRNILKEWKKNWDPKKLEELDAAKKDFVKALFKKNG